MVKRILIISTFFIYFANASLAETKCKYFSEADVVNDVLVNKKEHYTCKEDNQNFLVTFFTDPKWPHYGLDFAADEGTKIKAMLDGTVTMAEPDLFYTGGTLIFDHGHGISTLYMHMKKILVKEGHKVKQGDVIGTVGSTGRVTGAHLDVRLNWFQTRLDPATVLDIK